jgi:ketosteroid isomerase-like protein
MYASIIESKIRASFDALNRRDASVALSLMADDVHYRFEGHHALGGERVTRAGVAKWFERLFRLVESSFSIKSVDVVGWPWRSTVYTTFEDHVTPPVGEPYVNCGVQIAEIRWGRAVKIRTYLDTGRVEAVLGLLSKSGIAEASAPPIEE